MNNYAIAYICLQIAGALVAANAHGKSQVGKHNFWFDVISASPAWVCLYYGGFFK